MAPLVSSVGAKPQDLHSVELLSAGFDIDDPNRASVWTRLGNPEIDWTDDVNMMMIGLDRDGKVMKWNARAEEVTDFTEKELVGYSFARHLISCPLAGLVELILQKTWAGEDVGCFQISFFTKSGVKLWLEVMPSVCCEQTGGSAEYLLLKAVPTDELLRRRSTSECATMTVHVDLDGHVREWDAGAEQISEFTKDHMIGKDFLNTFILANQREPLEDAFMQSLVGKQNQSIPATLVHKRSGTKTWLSFRTVPKYQVCGKQVMGQAVGVVFVAHVTDEPVAEQQEQTTTCDSLAAYSSEPGEDGVKRSIGTLTTLASLEGVSTLGDIAAGR